MQGELDQLLDPLTIELQEQKLKATTYSNECSRSYKLC